MQRNKQLTFFLQRNVLALCIVCAVTAGGCTEQTPATRASEQGQGAAGALALPTTISLGLEALGWSAAGAAVLPYAVGAAIAAPVVGLAYSTHVSQAEAQRYAGYAVTRLQYSDTQNLDFSNIDWYYQALANAQQAQSQGWLLARLVPITETSFASNYTDVVFAKVLDATYSAPALDAMSNQTGTSGLAAAQAWSTAIVNYAQRALFERNNLPAPANIELGVPTHPDALKQHVVEALSSAAIYAAQLQAEKTMSNVAIVAIENYGILAAYYLQGYIAGSRLLASVHTQEDIDKKIEDVNARSQAAADSVAQAGKTMDEELARLEQRIADRIVAGEKPAEVLQNELAKIGHFKKVESTEVQKALDSLAEAAAAYEAATTKPLEALVLEVNKARALAQAAQKLAEELGLRARVEVPAEVNTQALIQPQVEGDTVIREGIDKLTRLLEKLSQLNPLSNVPEQLLPRLEKIKSALGL